MEITGEKATLIASYEQDAFGYLFSGSSDGYHLTTKEYHSNIHLYYFYHRWYDPEFGCFLRKSIYAPLKEHNYVYTENNPSNYFDLYGWLSFPGIPLYPKIAACAACLTLLPLSTAVGCWSGCRKCSDPDWCFWDCVAGIAKSRSFHARCLVCAIICSGIQPPHCQEQECPDWNKNPSAPKPTDPGPKGPYEPEPVPVPY